MSVATTTISPVYVLMMKRIVLLTLISATICGMAVATPPAPTNPAPINAAPANPAPAQPPAPPITPPEQPTAPVTVTLRDHAKLPSSPGFFRLIADVNIGHKQFPIAFGLFLPQAYFSSQERFPLIVALHNRGLEGSHAEAVECEGMVSLWPRATWDNRDKNVGPSAQSLDLRKAGLFIGLAPQSPKGREMHVAPMPQVLAALMESISAAYRIDTDRAYLTGFSYGGTQTWHLAEQLPTRFAAIVPVSARATPDPATTAATLAQIPTYIGCGEIDSFFASQSKLMHVALQSAGHSDLVFRAVPGGNHFSYCSIYTDPAFYDWLLSKRLSQRPTTRPFSTTQSAK